MPDLLQYRITKHSDQIIGTAIPRFTLEARIVDSKNQNTILTDLTGANAIDFALRVQNLSAQDHRDLVETVAQWILMRKSGLV